MFFCLGDKARAINGGQSHEMLRVLSLGDICVSVPCVTKSLIFLCQGKR